MCGGAQLCAKPMVTAEGADAVQVLGIFSKVRVNGCARTAGGCSLTHASNSFFLSSSFCIKSPIVTLRVCLCGRVVGNQWGGNHKKGARNLKMNSTRFFLCQRNNETRCQLMRVTSTPCGHTHARAVGVAVPVSGSGWQRV